MRFVLVDILNLARSKSRESKVTGQMRLVIKDGGQLRKKWLPDLAKFGKLFNLSQSLMFYELQTNLNRRISYGASKNRPLTIGIIGTTGNLGAMKHRHGAKSQKVCFGMDLQTPILPRTLQNIAATLMFSFQVWQKKLVDHAFTNIPDNVHVPTQKWYFILTLWKSSIFKLLKKLSLLGGTRTSGNP